MTGVQTCSIPISSGTAAVDMAGKNNKQYGLILASKAAAGQAPSTSRKNVFGDDSDSDSDDGGDWVKKSLKREAQKSVLKRATKVQMKQALAEDPTVFQYDEIYDDLELKKVEVAAAKKGPEKKPRYIQALLQTAERRKKENERRIERQVQKEREEEGNEFADKESFVTSSYRQKLEEFKKQEEEEKRMERLEAIGDVTKQKDLTGFYRHLFRQTMGESLPGSSDAIKKENVEDDNDDGNSEQKSITNEKPSQGSKAQEPKREERKKDRHYRRRRSNSSSSAMSDAEEKDKSISIKIEKDVDADSDFTGSSSSSSESESSISGSGSEEGEITKKRKGTKNKKEDDSQQKRLKKDVDDKSGNIPESVTVKVEDVSGTPPSEKEKPVGENGSLSNEDKKSGEVDENESSNDVDRAKEPVKPKIDLWAKRTVGQVFDDAVQRYYQRKALKGSASGRMARA